MRDLRKTLLVSVLFWVAWVGVVVVVKPPDELSLTNLKELLAFFTPFSLAVFFLLAFIFRSAKRGLIFAFGFLVIAMLQLMKLLNLFNLTLLVVALAFFDRYFSER